MGGSGQIAPAEGLRNRLAERRGVTTRGGQREDEKEYLHRGIATRAFVRSIFLADHMEVKGASLENGMLTVELAREVPEALKPRTIEIK